ncbi:MAG: hypothetical protein SFH39_07670 [Candidatus Magnetobacterium sp. LHC-1]|nr:hypothetical protein [Nitrospirota bacterium]
MAETQSICAICAWREHCKKKFTVSGQMLRCNEFSKDITIKDDKKENTPKPE